jgi:hypothetical protein
MCALFSWVCLPHSFLAKECVGIASRFPGVRLFAVGPVTKEAAKERECPCSRAGAALLGMTPCTLRGLQADRSLARGAEVALLSRWRRKDRESPVFCVLHAPARMIEP